MRRIHVRQVEGGWSVEAEGLTQAQMFLNAWRA
jgi:hypothetical protein